MTRPCELRYPGDAPPFPVHVVTDLTGRGVELVTPRSRAIELLNVAGMKRRSAVVFCAAGFESARDRRRHLDDARWLLEQATRHRHRPPVTVLP